MIKQNRSIIQDKSETPDKITQKSVLEKKYAIEVLYGKSFEVFGRFYDTMDQAVFAIESMAKSGEAFKITETYVKVPKRL